MSSEDNNHGEVDPGTPGIENSNGKKEESHGFDCYCPCGGLGGGTVKDQVLEDEEKLVMKTNDDDDEVGRVRSLGDGKIPFDENEMPAPVGRRTAFKPTDDDEQKTVEILWDGEDEKEGNGRGEDDEEILKERTWMERMMGISRDARGLGGRKQSNLALVDNGETVEAQRTDDDGSISIDGRDGERTKVTFIGGKENNRSRKCIWLLLFMLAVAGFVTAMILGLGSLRSKKSEKSETSDTDALGQEEEVNDNGSSGGESDNNGSASEGEGGASTSIGILSTGCFQYEESGDLVCLLDDDPADSLCTFIVNGEVCSSCEICDMDSGSIRVDCTGLVDDSSQAIINDLCLDPTIALDIYDGTLVEAFTDTEDANALGSWVSTEGGNGGSGGTSQERGASPFTTGCFDYKFRLNGGVVVCLEDEDPTDDVCTLEVDGEPCNSCSICDPVTGMIQADCSNLRVSTPIINGNCGNEKTMEGTILEAFLDDRPNDSNRSDGVWIEKDMVGVCQDSIESGYSCYGVGSQYQVGFMNCDPKQDDWIGIYPPDADPQDLGDPISNWWWLCGPTKCQDLFNQGVLYFRADMEPGSYRAFLIRDGDQNDGKHVAYASSDVFEVHYDESSCEDPVRFL